MRQIQTSGFRPHPLMFVFKSSRFHVGENEGKYFHPNYRFRLFRHYIAKQRRKQLLSKFPHAFQPSFSN